MHRIATRPMLLIFAVYVLASLIALLYYGPSEEAVNAIASIAIGSLLAFVYAYILDLLR